MRIPAGALGKKPHPPPCGPPSLSWGGLLAIGHLAVPLPGEREMVTVRGGAPRKPPPSPRGGGGATAPQNLFAFSRGACDFFEATVTRLGGSGSGHAGKCARGPPLAGGAVPHGKEYRGIRPTPVPGSPGQGFVSPATGARSASRCMPGRTTVPRSVPWPARAPGCGSNRDRCASPR